MHRVSPGGGCPGVRPPRRAGAFACRQMGFPFRCSRDRRHWMCPRGQCLTRAGRAMQNFWYQILHSWHWLTYGQNGAALSAVAAVAASLAAVLGLVGLYFYTKYTRKLMLPRAGDAARHDHSHPGLDRNDRVHPFGIKRRPCRSTWTNPGTALLCCGLSISFYFPEEPMSGQERTTPSSNRCINDGRFGAYY